MFENRGNGWQFINLSSGTYSVYTEVETNVTCNFRGENCRVGNFAVTLQKDNTIVEILANAVKEDYSITKTITVGPGAKVEPGYYTLQIEAGREGIWLVRFSNQ